MNEDESTYFNLGISGDQDLTMKNYFSKFPEELLASLIDSFVINKPMTGKVGGDGFWIHRDKSCLILALFDCQGHGHLASMMTRVYTQLLTRIVIDEEVDDPGTILRYLHHKIVARVTVTSESKIKPSADVGLVKIDLDVRKIEYSGAKINLLHVVDGKLFVVKADRMPVGDYLEHPHEYETRLIKLKNELGSSNFYLASDGFGDLMGGEDSKRLGKRTVEQTLLEASGKEMVAQKTFLETFINDFQGNSMQLDDLLLIGFSL